jgi:hypothetical protein
VCDSTSWRLTSNVALQSAGLVATVALSVSLTPEAHHHHHQFTKLSHSINAIAPAPHRGGIKREHRSIMFATIMHIPSLHKIHLG